MDKTSLGDRMKEYEKAYSIKLPRRMPVIIRVDGKSFHTLTKGMDKPFDMGFVSLMNETAKYLCENISGSQLAYVQSDEISILVHNYKKLNTEPWFDNKLQKMCSISAGLASSYFTEGFNLDESLNKWNERYIQFDSRIFVLPEEEVVNYFLWRQQDCTRNSISMVAQSLYSHKELHKKNQNEMQEMIFQKGINWNDYDIGLKRGRCIIKEDRPFKSEFIDDDGCSGISTTFKREWVIDNEIPIFTQERDYISSHLAVEEE